MDTRLTEEAKRVDVATALGEGWGQIQTVIEDEAGDVLSRGLAQVERTLGGLRTVAPEDLSRSEMARWVSGRRSARSPSAPSSS